MPKGSCACGSVTYEIPENPRATVVCHCPPCQKFAGSNGSTLGFVSKNDFKVLSGDLSTWSRPGETGKKVTNNFCAQCGIMVVHDVEAIPDWKVFNTGTLEDRELLNSLPVEQEIYVRNRSSYVSAFEGAKQTQGRMAW